jgi:anti-anti-sigma factor
MLKIHTRNLGSVAVLGLQGRMVRGEVEALRKAVEAQSKTVLVILDLARVTAIDAGALGLMLQLRQQADARGMRLELMNVNRWVRQVLAVTRLDSVFRITSSVEFLPIALRRNTSTPPVLASCA